MLCINIYYIWRCHARNFRSVRVYFRPEFSDVPSTRGDRIVFNFPSTIVTI